MRLPASEQLLTVSAPNWPKKLSSAAVQPPVYIQVSARSKLKKLVTVVVMQQLGAFLMHRLVFILRLKFRSTTSLFIVVVS